MHWMAPSEKDSTKTPLETRRRAVVMQARLNPTFPLAVPEKDDSATLSTANFCDAG